MHCKDTTVELDVYPEEPEVLVMTCVVRFENLKHWKIECFPKSMTMILIIFDITLYITQAGDIRAWRRFFKQKPPKSAASRLVLSPFSAKS